MRVHDAPLIGYRVAAKQVGDDGSESASQDNENHSVAHVSERWLWVEADEEAEDGEFDEHELDEVADDDDEV